MTEKSRDEVLADLFDSTAGVIVALVDAVAILSRTAQPGQDPSVDRILVTGQGAAQNCRQVAEALR